MSIKASSQVSLIDITDAYSVILTSESYTFIGNTSGAPSGLSCSTQVVAFCGSASCSKVSIGTITCPTGISATISNNNTSSPTVTFKTTATVTTACEATIPVSVDSVTINKKFSFAVAKQGSTGAKGDTGATGPQGPKGDKGDTGATGATGKGVKSSAVTYQASTSGTTIPTGTWSSSIPSVSAGSYLWTRTIITYTDNTTSTSYSVGKMGNTGATGATGATGPQGPKGDTGATGNGIKSTVITYQAGSSGTTAPTGTWSSTVPETSASTPYLWTKTVITYTNGSTTTSYNVGSTPEGIVVGGRNLLLNSADLTKWTPENGTTVKADTDGYFKISTTHNSYWWSTEQDVTLDAGSYTVSGYFKAGSKKGTLIIRRFDNRDVIVEKLDVLGYFKHSFTISETTKVRVHIGLSPTAIGDYVYAKLFKLEKGNKATDWTPAPEDVDSAINDVNDRIDETNSSITQTKENILSTVSSTYATKTALNTVDGKFTNYSTTAQMNSAINQKADSITSTVSSTYATKTEFNGLQVGGRNLLLNSEDLTKWTKEVGVSVVKDSDGWFKVVDSVHRANRWGIIFDLENYEQNTDYTLSVDAKYGNAKIGIAHGFGNLGASNDQSIESGSKRLKTTFNTSSNTAPIRVYLNITPTATNQYGYFKLPKLEKGNKATDWTPAPEDVDSAINTVNTLATQTANKFNWLVKSGTSATDFTLTDRTATLVSDYINLKGLVTFDGLSSDVRDRVTDVESLAGSAISTANTAKTNAANAQSTANSAGATAGTALTRATHQYGTCSTAAATVAKVVTLSGFTLFTGAKISVKFTYANESTSPTLNVNNTGAKTIYAYGSAIAASGPYSWKAGATVDFVYNGSQWEISGNSADGLLADWCYDNNKTYINGGKIYTGTITADKIAANAITADKLNVNNLSSITANVGEWLITDGYLQSDSASSGSRYRAFIQKPTDSDTWCFSTQYTSDGSTFTATSLIRANGYAYFEELLVNGKLEADGDLKVFGKGYFDKDVGVIGNINTNGAITAYGNIKSQTGIIQAKGTIEAASSSGASNFVLNNGTTRNVYLRLDGNYFYILPHTSSGYDTAHAAYMSPTSGAFSVASLINRSSKRYKENITEMDDEIANRLLELKVKHFDYKPEYGDKDMYGMIAEDVLEIHPNAVAIGPDDLPEGIDYTRFVPLIIRKIQMQEKEINDLKETINDLKDTISEMKETINNLINK